MPANFVHLRVHSEYSLVDSVVRIRDLVSGVAAAGMPAVALTDESSLFALVKLYARAESQGIKPLIGADLWLAKSAEVDHTSRVTLLCQNEEGYRNLSRLVSRSYLEGQQHGLPVVEHAWLSAHSAGLIALSGAREGDLGLALLAGRPDAARRRLDAWRTLFTDRFYIEVQRTGREGEARYLQAAVELAAATETPLVATNDVRFLRRDDFEAHEARVCIHDGRRLDDPRRRRPYSDAQYLKSAAEMAETFSDLPEALENTLEIARRCNLSLTLGKHYLPNFPLPDDASLPDFLAREARAGLDTRLAHTAGDAEPAVYAERLEHELGVIVQMGFPGYFLIVADFCRWAREHDVPVGPGRGSGAGSLVAYGLGITDLDPIRHELLFERFLNPERVSMPDFDIDFCMEGRDRVIDYVAERYGRDKVSQIITFGTMAARAVVRDVGRVLGHPYGYVDRIAKLIPFEIGMTLEKALEQEAELKQEYDDNEEVRALIDLARALEGLARNAGKHAGGVVIAPGPLTDFTPLYSEQGGAGLVSQLDKDDVEKIGLVKFDFLGLRTLTIIDRAVKEINRRRRTAGEAELDMAAAPNDDAEVYALLKRCETTAVFQLESRGMKDLIRRLQPDRFEDIVALVALFRPGPLQSGMVDDFIDRKHGRAEVSFPHPALKSILEPTYGVILYQEQVMQIAQVLAGYTLGGADLLRRAMGKKKAAEMAKQRDVFVTGACERDVDAAVATHIFDLMEKFAGYGFNKSHSAAYALLTYQTAWLKVYYPAAFMAAVLSSDMDHTDKVVRLIDECRAMRLKILPPSINESEYMFTMSGEGAIRYGLGAIKGVGRSAVEALLAERESRGAFNDLNDLCRRSDGHKAGRRTLEALIQAGALDELGHNRASLMETLPGALQLAEQHQWAHAAGQDDLFGLASSASESASAATDAPPAALPEWDDDARLAAEKQTLGLYLTGHPFARYARELKRVTSGTIADLSGAVESSEGGYGARQRPATVAGLVFDVRKRGGRVSVTLDDRTGRLEAVLFDATFQRYRNLIVKDRILVVEGKLGFDEFINAYRVTAQTVSSIDEIREAYVHRLVVHWTPGAVENGFFEHLRDVLEAFRPGGAAVDIQYHGATAGARIALGDAWRVQPADSLIKRIEALPGVERVGAVYSSEARSRTTEDRKDQASVG
jgi:DNA polymerase-3 subunit alpha